MARSSCTLCRQFSTNKAEFRHKRICFIRQLKPLPSAVASALGFVPRLCWQECTFISDFNSCCRCRVEHFTWLFVVHPRMLSIWMRHPCRDLIRHAKHPPANSVKTVKDESASSKRQVERVTCEWISCCRFSNGFKLVALIASSVFSQILCITRESVWNGFED